MEGGGGKSRSPQGAKVTAPKKKGKKGTKVGLSNNKKTREGPGSEGECRVGPQSKRGEERTRAQRNNLKGGKIIKNARSIPVKKKQN